MLFEINECYEIIHNVKYKTDYLCFAGLSVISSACMNLSKGSKFEWQVNPINSIYTLSCRDSSFLKSDNNARWRSLIYVLIHVSRNARVLMLAMVILGFKVKDTLLLVSTNGC